MSNDPPIIDVAAIAPPTEHHTVGHHVRRAAYVSASCLIAIGVLSLFSIALMVGAYLALRH